MSAMPAQTLVPDSTELKIRQILKDHGRLIEDAASLDLEADLYEAGMTSHASVNVMLALEAEFEIEFPDSMLKRTVFESIAAIGAAVAELHDR
jgi:acyl carrier protein